MNSDKDTLPSPSVSASACNAVASSRVVPVATANSSTDNCSLPSVSAAMKCSAALVNSSSSVTGISSGETAGSGAVGSGTGSGMTSCTGSDVTGTIGSGTGSGAGVETGTSVDSSLRPISKAPAKASCVALATCFSFVVSTVGSTTGSLIIGGSSTFADGDS